MGEHAGGEVASTMAVEAITAYVREHLAESEAVDQAAVLLQAAIRTADEVIWATGRAHRELRDMGTTVVLALFRGHQAHIGHVGDSRAYLLRQGELLQLREDHSAVARLIKTGQLTPEGAHSHPLRHQISRYLGNRQAVPDLHCVTWWPGDYLLLCSDGLTNMLEDHHLKGLILQSGTDVHAACEALVARANAHGGEDNISVILAYQD
jgi:protein phosphatase